MASNGRIDAKSGMLAFDEETGRKMEAVYLTSEAAARRQALRGALRLQSGEYGLYIGSGPGFAPCEIAQALGPAGRLAVVEKNAAMLTMTERRAAGEGLLDRLDLQEGDAVALPFSDGVFAFVGSAQVFEYVPDVARAVAEAYRVLRPGGRLALIDTDWQTLIWHAADEHLGTRVATTWEGHLAHNHLPRRLKPLLSRAGFQIERVEPIIILNTDYTPNTFSFMLLQIVADYVRGTGKLSNAEVDAWVTDVQRQGSEGSYFFSLNQYLFVAHRSN
jgi:ubiquinone/menaquinone biosynthesis C-methylase UbiE